MTCLFKALKMKTVSRPTKPGNKKMLRRRASERGLGRKLVNRFESRIKQIFGLTRILYLNKIRAIF